uniref:Uncharacterized protein n=1 Tax=Siphoviridae sp. ctBrh2 TaxID=2827804 RepID=A0A8S5S758_9CAUD|nr:MAG TPA: hypothetical protein [Siphoviridae sp. ctBrh2]
MKHISFFAIFFDVLFYSDILLFPSQLLQLLEFVTIGVTYWLFLFARPLSAKNEGRVFLFS